MLLDCFLHWPLQKILNCILIASTFNNYLYFLETSIKSNCEFNMPVKIFANWYTCWKFSNLCADVGRVLSPQFHATCILILGIAWIHWSCQLPHFYNQGLGLYVVISCTWKSLGCWNDGVFIVTCSRLEDTLQGDLVPSVTVNCLGIWQVRHIWQNTSGKNNRTTTFCNFSFVIYLIEYKSLHFLKIYF